MAEITFREANNSDIPFLTSSWLKSYRDAPAVRGVPNKVYYYFHHKVLEELISRGMVLVLHYEHTPDQILGWVCYETYDSAMLLHYMYIKKSFRGFGLARKVLEEILDRENPPVVLYTHKTTDIFPIERKLRDKGWVFHPYMLWTSMPEGWENND